MDFSTFMNDMMKAKRVFTLYNGILFFQSLRSRLLQGEITSHEESFSLEDFLDLIGKKFDDVYVWSHDNGNAKCYTWTETIDQFVDNPYFKNITQSIPQHFYEVIPENVARKFAMDLDLTRDKYPHYFNGKSNHDPVDIILQALKYVIPELNYERDIIILTAHREDKKSYHIIVDNYHCLNKNHARDVYEELNNKLKSFFDDWDKAIIDHAIYGSNQNFRLPYCSKIGKNNNLVFSNSYTIKGKEINLLQKPLREQCKRAMWRHINEDSKLIASFGNINEKQAISRKIKLTDNTSTNKGCLNLPDNIYSLFPELFDRLVVIKNMNGSMILFKNQSGYKCPTCNIIHQHENPMVIINCSGEVLFNCRRSDVYYHLGNVEVDKEVEPNGTPKVRKSLQLPDKYYFIEPYKPMDSYNYSRFVRPIDLENYDVHIEKAPMGAGKSYSIRHLIQDGNYKRVLYLSARQIYASSVCGELNQAGLNFMNYLDVPNKEDMSNYNRLVIQMESIHYIKNYDYDLLIMDESESLMKQFSSTTMSKNIFKIVYTFERLIQQSKKIVAMDAFMTYRTQFVLDVLKYGSKIYSVENKYPLQSKQAIEHPTPPTFYKSIFQSLEENKKICCVWSSKTKMLQFNEQLIKRGYKTLIYFDKTDDRDKRALSNVNQIWSDPSIQVVMYSPTITVGVNFDLPKIFDKIYVWGTCMSCPVRDIIQGTMRVRQFNENVMEYHLNSTYFGDDITYLYLSYEQILKLFKDYETHYVERITRENLDLDNPYLPNWYVANFVFNKREEHASNRDYKRVFIHFLKECGYTQFDICSQKITDKIFIDDTKKFPRYDDIPPIQNDDEYERIQHRIQNKLASTTDKWKNDKYHFDKKIINKHTLVELLEQNNVIDSGTEEIPDVVEETYDLIKEDLWVKWNEDGKQIIKNISTEKNRSLSSVLQSTNDSRMMSDSYGLQYSCIIDLCNIIKSKDSLTDIEISIDDFSKYTNDICNMESKITDAFRKKTTVKENGIKKAVKLLDIAFSGWNGSTITTRSSNNNRLRKRINGKIVDTSPVVKSSLFITTPSGNIAIEDLVR